MDDDGRVLIETGELSYTVCPSYGLNLHIHNDTLASLLCKVLGKGDVGLAQDVTSTPAFPQLERIELSEDRTKVTLGEEVFDGCRGMNTSLAVICKGNEDLKARLLIKSYLKINVTNTT